MTGEERVFPDEEFAARREKLCAAMAAAALDGLVVSTPENIFYLTGLDHQGFFALHLLIVTAAGEMTLIARAMERVTVEDQVTGARFVGYADNEDPGRLACTALRDCVASPARVEQNASRRPSGRQRCVVSLFAPAVKRRAHSRQHHRAGGA